MVNKITKLQLEKLYSKDKNNLKQIGKLIGRSSTTIHRLFKRLGIKTRTISEANKIRHSIDGKLYKNKDWLILNYVKKGLSLEKIAKIVNTHYRTISFWLKRHDIKVKESGWNFKKGMLADQSYRWRGGIKKTKKGFIEVYKHGHPYANKKGYVKQHRLIMERHLGRILKPNEKILHLDGNRSNNSVENLRLFRSQEELASFTSAGERNPAWEGGLSFKPYSSDFNKSLRMFIKDKFRGKCQLCGLKEDICIHHIDYNKNNSFPDNLVSLCRTCNIKVNNKRTYWSTFFRKMIEEDKYAQQTEIELGKTQKRY